MSLSVKRQLDIKVSITEPFKKKYIVFVNSLINELDKKIDSYKLTAKSLSSDLAFRPYIVEKINESLMKKEQLKQQISAVKVCKEGELFTLSNSEAYTNLAIGDDILSVLTPVSITVDDSKITEIIG